MLELKLALAGIAIWFIAYGVDSWIGDQYPETRYSPLSEFIPSMNYGSLTIDYTDPIRIELTPRIKSWYHELNCLIEFEWEGERYYHSSILSIQRSSNQHDNARRYAAEFSNGIRGLILNTLMADERIKQTVKNAVKDALCFK